MRAFTIDRLETWRRWGTIVVLMILAWAMLAPGAGFWTALLALGLVGVALATTLLVRSRRAPSLAGVIATAEAKPAAIPVRRQQS